MIRNQSYDPSRTTLLRKQFVNDVVIRYKKLNKTVKEAEKDDTDPILFGYLVDQEIERSFKQVQPISGKPWFTLFVASAHKRGIGRSFIDKPNDYLTREAFVADVLRRENALKNLEYVAQENLNAILATAKQEAVRDNVLSNKIQTRLKQFARTEVIKSHAEGQLDGFDVLGVKKVSGRVEFATAGDSRVCELCAELEGTVYSVDEARGIIPVHPNCRCAWFPID